MTTADVVAQATDPHAPRVRSHDLGGSEPSDAEVLRCKRCMMPYPQTGFTGCLAEGETLRDWYGGLPKDLQQRIPVTPENFHRFYRPNADRLIVRPDDAPEKSPSGLLWYPPSFIEKMRYHQPFKGTVMGVGPGMLTYKGGRWPLCSDKDGPELIKPGVRILFMPQGGFEVLKIGGEVLLSLRDDFVIALIEEE